MSILKDVYKLEELNGRSQAYLETPLVKYFTLDLNNITKEQNLNSSVFWNFGDPESGHNEIVSPSIVNSTVKHTYATTGTYHVTCIVNVDGVPFHLEQDVFADGASYIPVEPTLTWGALSNITEGSIVTSDLFNITSNVAGTFVYNPIIGTILDLGTHTISATFIPTDPHFKRMTITNTVTVVVPSAGYPVPSIEWGTFNYLAVNPSNAVERLWTQDFTLTGTPVWADNGDSSFRIFTTQTIQRSLIGTDEGVWGGGTQHLTQDAYPALSNVAFNFFNDITRLDVKYELRYKLDANDNYTGVVSSVTYSISDFSTDKIISPTPTPNVNLLSNIRKGDLYTYYSLDAQKITMTKSGSNDRAYNVVLNNGLHFKYADQYLPAMPNYMYVAFEWPSTIDSVMNYSLNKMYNGYLYSDLYNGSKDVGMVYDGDGLVYPNWGFNSFSTYLAGAEVVPPESYASINYTPVKDGSWTKRVLKMPIPDLNGQLPYYNPEDYIDFSTKLNISLYSAGTTAYTGTEEVVCSFLGFANINHLYNSNGDLVTL
jgi:hypothetical protein